MRVSSSSSSSSPSGDEEDDQFVTVKMKPISGAGIITYRMQWGIHETVEEMSKRYTRLVEGRDRSADVQFLHAGRVLAWNATPAGRNIRSGDVVHVVENLRGD